MNKITPFLWFNDNAEDAAEFYLSVFPEAKKLGELRSSGVGPWRLAGLEGANSGRSCNTGDAGWRVRVL
jgi:hypothetical protein